MTQHINYENAHLDTDDSCSPLPPTFVLLGGALSLKMQHGQGLLCCVIFVHDGKCDLMRGTYREVGSKCTWTSTLTGYHRGPPLL